MLFGMPRLPNQLEPAPRGCCLRPTSCFVKPQGGTMMRVLMPSAAAILFIAMGLLLVLGSAASAQVQSPSPNLSQEPQNIPDQKLDAAAAAIGRVANLKQDYQQRIAAASPADKERLVDE